MLDIKLQTQSGQFLSLDYFSTIPQKITALKISVLEGGEPVGDYQIPILEYKDSDMLMKYCYLLNQKATTTDDISKIGAILNYQQANGLLNYLSTQYYYTEHANDYLVVNDPSGQPDSNKPDRFGGRIVHGQYVRHLNRGPEELSPDELLALVDEKIHSTYRSRYLLPLKDMNDNQLAMSVEQNYPIYAIHKALTENQFDDEHLIILLRYQNPLEVIKAQVEIDMALGRAEDYEDIEGTLRSIYLTWDNDCAFAKDFAFYQPEESMGLSSPSQHDETADKVIEETCSIVSSCELEKEMDNIAAFFKKAGDKLLQAALNLMPPEYQQEQAILKKQSESSVVARDKIIEIALRLDTSTLLEEDINVEKEGIMPEM